MESLWALINSMQLLSYMGFLYWNLTPPVYIVFNMLLVSHFDTIPLSSTLSDLASAQEDAKGVPQDKAYTENMGILTNDTQLIYVNLSDIFISLGILFATFVVVKLLLRWLPERFV